MSQFYASYPHLLSPPLASSRTPKPRQNQMSALSKEGGGSAGMTPSASTSSLGLGGRLRSMLDRQKYAIFQVDVTLHELGNVPQLEGEFAVRWRFRGKRPKARDAVHRLHAPTLSESGAHSVGPSPKPSLPNLKLSQPSYPGSLHPSTSSISLRSSSTGGSSSIRSGQLSIHGPPSPHNGGTGGSATPAKSFSTPPLGMTSMNHNGSGGGGIGGKGHPHIRVDKKGSDPTPLRQSVGVEPDLETVESPASLAGSETASLAPSGDSTPLTHRQPSRSSTLPPTHPLATNSTASTRQSTVTTPSASMPGTGPSSASSSVTHLSVPHPRSSTTPLPMERAGSQLAPSVRSGNSGSASAGSQADLASLGVRNGDRPAPRRVRSISGASFNQANQPQASSSKTAAGKDKSVPLSARHGVTAGRPLKSHSCTWDHDLQLALRLPISKDRDRSRSETPGFAASTTSFKTRAGAPILGEGSDSSSGLRLIIEQLPTAAATSAAHAKSSDPALPSQAQAAEESYGNRHTSAAAAMRGERTVFGKVDIDLAAFAGRGKTTRKFLLGGSRTNATMKLTVEMTWIGGDPNWVAPPLQEGHHVTSGIRDVVGGRDAGQDLERDLALVKTPSASSTDSSASNNRTRSIKSRNGSSLNLARAVSSSTMSQPRPQYKTYDHHLLSPEDAKTRPKHDMGRPGSIDASTSSPAPSKQSGDERNGGSSATEGQSQSQSPTRSLFPLQWHHRHHHRHHHHLHSHHHAQHKTHGITELSPEAVIEHVFNPYESHEEGPFTYVAPPRPPPLRDEEEQHEHAPPPAPGAVESEHTRQHRLGWRRRNKERKEMSRTASGLGLVMGAASGTAGGALHAQHLLPVPHLGGQGVSGAATPSRTGTSTPVHA